jgi:hypothetical protein
VEFHQVRGLAERRGNLRDLHPWQLGAQSLLIGSLGLVRYARRWAARFTPTDDTRTTLVFHPSFLPVPGPPFTMGAVRHWPPLAWSPLCKASWVAQKRPRDPTSPRAPLWAGRTCGPTRQRPDTSSSCGPTWQPSALPCNCERDLFPSAPRKNSRLPRPPSSSRRRPTDIPTNRGRPRWRWLAFASASSTATVSCRRRSLRRRCGPREVVALEPFDGMPLRGWG